MAYSKCCGSGNQLVSCRVGEKSDLQDLNQRFAEYINKVRSWRFLQVRILCLHLSMSNLVYIFFVFVSLCKVVKTYAVSKVAWIYSSYF